MKSNPKNRIYISGQISGLDLELAKQRFENASMQAKKRLNLEPINPFVYGLQGKHKWITHMIFDIWLLLHCRSICMIWGWEKSKGARIEKNIAEFFRMKVYYE